MSFAPLARLWLTAERLARTLDRELVVWNLPCSFSWSGGSMAVTEERELGLAAAVVERTCAISAVRADTTGGIRSGATNDEQQLVRVPERCCTIFWDLSQRRCTRTPTRQHTRDHAHGRMHPPLYPHAPVIPRWYSYLCGTQVRRAWRAAIRMYRSHPSLALRAGHHRRLQRCWRQSCGAPRYHCPLRPRRP